ncbi:CDP-alcohol phosphatidyltransferase family protein [Psychroflexus sp. ALD_RP9]|uniref:CDP-alcohol phosphatidyltransferase family protein n=1 Tax=Psychroflexus sp. ALD_RP9 TaxID=2777186 RepID=UPI001A8C78B1|nr:CDP-alcohol phosphatidyltransferase family protein [Psychroflexus sp. ALD_RP9]QSS96539.1 CDP-alcohol phosphatidyltransferase family protein [Psychroflexus sp. ALD_RP9]
MNLKAQIPNIITLLNLFSGCLASIYAFQGDYLWAGFFVLLGIFFDFFDGFFARVLKVSTELGLQLDSLADMVTSGFVPGLVMFQLIGTTINPDFSLSSFDFFTLDSLALFGFIITLASAYRLANFNIDEAQTENFIGLPTPANAILVISTAILIEPLQFGFKIETLLLLTLVSSYLLNANLALFSFKFSNFNLNENWFRYVMIVVSIILLITLQLKAIPFIIGFYILLNLILNFKNKIF